MEEESSNQYTIAQIELINYVSAEMQSGKVLDMNASKEWFNKFQGNADQLNYQRMIKPLLVQNIRDVAFTKPAQKKKKKISLRKWAFQE